MSNIKCLNVCIFIILTLYISRVLYSHKCSHNAKINQVYNTLNSFKNIKQSIIKNQFIKFLQLKNKNIHYEFTPQQDNYDNIRIHVDYSLLEKLVKDDFSFINNYKSIINKTIYLYEELIKVKRFTKYLKLTDSIAIELKDKYNNSLIPEYIQRKGVPSDFILFVTVTSDIDKDEAEAWGYNCANNRYDNRPICGIVALNKNRVNFSKQNWKKYYTNLMFHEISHALLFSPFLWSYFWDDINKKTIDRNKVIKHIETSDGFKKSLIITPNVIKTAKKHFNCNKNFEGIELEDHGSFGTSISHWESKIMLGDYMIAEPFDDIAISEISLAFFEDSGWYKTNKYTGGLFKFGLNSGCDIFDKKCINLNKKSNFPDFYCDIAGKPSCMVGKHSKGKCSINSYKNIIDERFTYFDNRYVGGFVTADYCPVISGNKSDKYYYSGHCSYGEIILIQKDLNEVISNNSGCFISSLGYNNKKSPVSVCYKYKCDYNYRSVVITIDKETIYCPKEGARVNLYEYKGDLICPSFDEYCRGTNQCYDLEDCILKKSTFKVYDNNCKKLPTELINNYTVIEKFNNDPCKFNENTDMIKNNNSTITKEKLEYDDTKELNKITKIVNNTSIYNNINKDQDIEKINEKKTKGFIDFFANNKDNNSDILNEINSSDNNNLSNKNNKFLYSRETDNININQENLIKDLKDNIDKIINVVNNKFNEIELDKSNNNNITIYNTKDSKIKEIPESFNISNSNESKTNNKEINDLNNYALKNKKSKEDISNTNDKISSNIELKKKDIKQENLNNFIYVSDPVPKFNNKFKKNNLDLNPKTVKDYMDKVKNYKINNI